MTGRAASDRDVPEDVLRAIAQYAAGDGERRSLEALGRELAEVLAQKAAARPEFAAELRARLLAGAAGATPATSPPRMRVAGEPVVPLHRAGGPAARSVGRRRWKIAAAAAAAAGLAAAIVVAVAAGRGGRAVPQEPPAQVAVGDAPSPHADRAGGEGPAGQPPSPAVAAVPREAERGTAPGPDRPGVGGAAVSIASYQPEGTELNLPLPASFQPADAGARVPAGVQARAGLLQVRLNLQRREIPGTRPMVYRLVPATWEASLLAEVSRRLGLGPLAAGAPGERRATTRDGSGTLRLTGGGELIYEERARPPADPVAIDESRARQSARDFFTRAGLPAPGGDPGVRTASYAGQGIAGAFWVEWTSRVPGGYPLLGGPDRVVVAPWGQVVHARLQRIRAEPLGVVSLKPVEEAARELNGLPVQGSGEVTLEAVELVYGRPEQPEAGEDLVAQPFYRYTGRTAEGWPYTGYVAATAGAPGPARALVPVGQASDAPGGL